MSAFRDLIKSISIKSRRKEKEALHFSERLRYALALSMNDLESARDCDVTFKIGKYIIYPINRTFRGTWHILLEVLPVDVFLDSGGHGAGWSNHPIELPSNWFYKPSGTTTILVPPSIVQEELILAAREL